MRKSNHKGLVLAEEAVTRNIYLIRNQKVMLDLDLATLYGVQTKQLKRAVKRNINRFPEDFMFELEAWEFENLRCQFGTSSWGGVRFFPMAFTEQGVAMLSSVLNSKRAIAVYSNHQGIHKIETDGGGTKRHLVENRKVGKKGEQT